jgi:hypothetical protein
MLGLPIVPIKLIQPIDLCIILLRGYLVEKKEIALGIMLLLYNLSALESQKTIVILQLLTKQG